MIKIMGKPKKLERAVRAAQLKKATIEVLENAIKKKGFKNHNSKVTSSSVSHDYCTPTYLLDLIREFHGGRIGLDPCSNKNSVVKARVNNTRAKADGLAISWRNHGLVFVNPPYGREIPKWISKANTEFSGKKGADSCILLLPARPDTKWFHVGILQNASAVVFLRGRITFKDQPTAAAFPSMLVYYGNDPLKFRDFFTAYGWVVTWKR